MNRRKALIFSAIFISTSGWATWTILRPQQVGEDRGNGILVSTGQLIHPVGETTTLKARPIDLAVDPNGKYVVAKTHNGLALLEAQSRKLLQEIQVDGSCSYYGVQFNKTGDEVFVTNAGSGLAVYSLANGNLKHLKTIALPGSTIKGASFPCGLALSTNGKQAYVCLSRDNSIAVVDLQTGKLSKTIPTDVAPYQIVTDGSSSNAYVTCWSAKTDKDKPSAESSGTPVPVDVRGIAGNGTLCKIDLGTGTMVDSVNVGAQPTEIAISNDVAWVVNANSDSLDKIDLKAFKRLTTFPLRVNGNLGQSPNSLTVDEKAKRIYVACGGRNTVMVLDQTSGKPIGEFPTGYYPSSVKLIQGQLWIANAKGYGSRNQAATSEGHNVYDFTGTIQVVKPETQLQRVSLDAKPSKPRENLAAQPVPDRVGEKTPIQHVVYIIKENRTYDQVFGDVKEGNGDPKLAIYGEQVTPNHHALAKQFVLLDNYYCNGVLSADGHAWTTEGNASTHYERSFGGWTRSYPFGDDPLATSQSGYFWDNLIAHGKTFRNYGEFDYASPSPSQSYTKLLQDFKAGKPLAFKHNIGVERVRKHSNPDFPGWNMGIPDVVRADIFKKDLQKTNSLADFTIVYLPQDHTSGLSKGSPTPKSHVADNDLALGHVVEAISHSKFWSSTCIFVVEDDPQDGFDHVDGHRSVCLVISPYTKHGEVISEFYNQTSVIRTMEHMLGLPPMNQHVADSPLMTACFQRKPDLTAYVARANNIPLDTLNTGKSTMRLHLEKPDMVNEDIFNRQLWLEAKGPSVPYPKPFAGAHGKGLLARGLAKIDSKDED